MRSNRTSANARLSIKANVCKVDAFFEWIDRQFERQGLLPSSPFTQALSYARERRLGLEVFLSDPDVAIDTNHLERALRVIPKGRSLCTSFSSV
jgi:transposase